MSDQELPFDVHPGENARVRISRGLTINLGNFSSARLDVGLEVPCVFSPENAAAAHDWTTDWCNGKLRSEARGLNEKIAQIMG